MIDQISAKNIARALWGEVASETACNREGVFWYSCASHGGMIVPEAVLSKTEKAALSPYAVSESFMPGKAYIFEEDIAWAIPGHLLGIYALGRGDLEATAADAKRMFETYIDPNSPYRKATERGSQARKNNDPDLVLAAFQHDSGKVRVSTADGKAWLVDDYAQASDAAGYKWLSHCGSVTEIDPVTFEIRTEDGPQP